MSTGFALRDATMIESGRTDSIQTMKFIAATVRRCETIHRACNNANGEVSPPTRMLELHEDYVRLVQVDQPMSLKYACLAHRWTAKHLHKELQKSLAPMRCCTLRKTLDRDGSRIGINSLLPGYRNAVEVTRSLGVRYLWIDSLCIVQDDPVDKQIQISNMGDIFSNSYVTIAADCDKDHTQSFFSSRTWQWDAQEEYLKTSDDMYHPVYFRERPNHRKLTWNGLFERAW